MIFKNRFVKVFSIAAMALTMASQARAEDPMGASTPAGAGLDTVDSLLIDYTINALSKIDIRAVGADPTDDHVTLSDIRASVDMKVADLHIFSNQPGAVYACSENGSSLVKDGSVAGTAGESVSYNLSVADAGASLPLNSGTALAGVALPECALGGATSLDAEVAVVNDYENSISAAEGVQIGTAREMKVLSSGDQHLLAGYYSDTIRLLIEAN